MVYLRSRPSTPPPEAHPCQVQPRPEGRRINQASGACRADDPSQVARTTRVELPVVEAQQPFNCLCSANQVITVLDSSNLVEEKTQGNHQSEQPDCPEVGHVNRLDFLAQQQEDSCSRSQGQQREELRSKLCD